MARATLTVSYVPLSVPTTKILAAFGKRASNAGAAADFPADPTLEFAAEGAVAVKDPPHTAAPVHRGRPVAVVLLGVIAAGLVTAGVYWKDSLLPSAAAASGNLRVESEPSGAEVKIDGAVKGKTPLSISVAAGNYRLTVQQGPSLKEMPVSVTKGTSTVYHIALADATTTAPETGALSVATDVAGSTVLVDGQDRGVAPLTLQNLTTGQHRVVVRARGTSYTRDVKIEAGATASLFVGTGQAAAPGSLALQSAVPLQVFEEGRLIGTSEMQRIVLAPGEHFLELSAESVGYRATRTVRVTPGENATLSVDLPRVPLSINAVPWAEVFIDGTRVGETPLGNVLEALGTHEVVFRHPQLGERRVSTVVGMKGPNRVSVDMRQQ